MLSLILLPIAAGQFRHVPLKMIKASEVTLNYTSTLQVSICFMFANTSVVKTIHMAELKVKAGKCTPLLEKGAKGTGKELGPIIQSIKICNAIVFAKDRTKCFSTISTRVAISIVLDVTRF